MPERIRLTEDGPLGKAGTVVWVNAEKAEKEPAKKAPAKPRKTSK